MFSINCTKRDICSVCRAFGDNKEKCTKHKNINKSLFLRCDFKGILKCLHIQLPNWGLGIETATSVPAVMSASTNSQTFAIHFDNMSRFVL